MHYLHLWEHKVLKQYFLSLIYLTVSKHLDIASYKQSFNYQSNKWYRNQILVMSFMVSSTVYENVSSGWDMVDVYYHIRVESQLQS